MFARSVVELTKHPHILSTQTINLVSILNILEKVQGVIKVIKGQIVNVSALVQVMAWCQTNRRQAII